VASALPISTLPRRHASQVSAQADMTPQGGLPIGLETPGSGAFAPGPFGSPQLGNMLAHQQHWPGAHLQCVGGGSTF
jgi:hypothetical protein